MSMSIFAILLNLWMICVYGQTKTCGRRHCIFDCTNGGECARKTLICEKSVVTCILNCKASGCKDGTKLISHAKYTTINCNDKDSCVGINAHCGNTRKVQSTYYSCSLNCGIVGCKEASLTCAGSFQKYCSVKAIDGYDGFVQGTFDCNLHSKQKCIIECVGNNCLGATYKCRSNSIDNHECQCNGNGCEHIYYEKLPMNLILPETTGVSVIEKHTTIIGTNTHSKNTKFPANWYTRKYVTIECKNGKCLNGLPIVCSKDVKTCIINCYSGECKAGVKFHSFAQITIINCLGVDACSSSFFECGDSSKNKNVIGKYLGCYANCDGISCKETHFQCTGDFSQGCVLTAGYDGADSFLLGKFECNIRNYGSRVGISRYEGKCQLSCGKPDFDGCKEATYICSGKHCSCKGYNCPKIIKTASKSAPIYTIRPTFNPTNNPSNNPSLLPTTTPTSYTQQPTIYPSSIPTSSPTINTNFPSNHPSFSPTPSPFSPTSKPTIQPTKKTPFPSIPPTKKTLLPSSVPTLSTKNPSKNPSTPPTISPTKNPSTSPTPNPTIQTSHPTLNPTLPSFHPTFSPTKKPTVYLGAPNGVFCEINSDCESKNCAIRIDMGTRIIGICVYPTNKCLPLKSGCHVGEFQCCSGKCKKMVCV